MCFSMSASRLVLLLLASVSAIVHGDCEFPIRRSRVLSSWQSSFGDRPTCFYNRTESDEEYALNNKLTSYRFFHSHNTSRADGGFHWFAVQLNGPVLIRSVTVKGREDGASFVYQRAVGIEIWTSGSSSQMFSGDHCSSRSMSRQFNESQQHWRLCGVTESKHSEITAGEIFTVNCVAEVRQLLLRRNITASNISSYHDYMSFSDLRLETVQLEPSEPQLVAENSSFSVSCSLHCKQQRTTNSGDMKICHPNGSCMALQHQVRIPRAQPRHSGKYTCKLGSVETVTSVTVLCTLSNVSILILKSDGCQSLSDMIVQFTSSSSQPVPEHRCSAEAGGIPIRNLTRLSQSSARHSSVSLWKLDGDGELSSAAVTCSAVQTLPVGIGLKVVRTDRAQLSCSFTSEVSAAALIAIGFGSGFIAAVSILFVFLRVSAFRHSGVCCQAVVMPGRIRVSMVSRGRGSAGDGCQTEAAGAAVARDAATEYENSDCKLENAAGVYVN